MTAFGKLMEPMFIGLGLKPARKPVPATTPDADHVALQLAAALCASGRYENPSAAVAAAWEAVPDYYIGRLRYLHVIAPAMWDAMTGRVPQQGLPRDDQVSEEPMRVADAINDRPIFRA